MFLPRAPARFACRAPAHINTIARSFPTPTFFFAASSGTKIAKLSTFRQTHSTKQQDQPPQPSQPQQDQEQHHHTPAYMQTRLEELREFQATNNGIALYPPAVKPTMKVSVFVDKFANSLGAGERDQHGPITLVGRVMRKREHSGKLAFMDLEQEGVRVQLMLTKAEYGTGDTDSTQVVPFEQWLTHIRRGDLIAARGVAGKTKKGELSLVVDHVTMLAPCLHQLPDKDSLLDPNIRYRHRYLDLLVNSTTAATFIQRAKVIKGVRRFLDDRDFLEVETAFLANSGGGASARPFLTFSNALGEGLQLRISPELYLKMLVIGGYERVYELGKQFRNEAVDATHNPEFTTCEFYMAHATADDLIDLTEEMLCEIASQFSPDCSFPSLEPNQPPIQFKRPFAKLDFVESIESALNCKLPDVNSPESSSLLVSLFHQHKLELPSAPHTTSRLLDALGSALIEPHCHQPTFVTNHPLLLSPLAKQHPIHKERAHRFELFVNGFELVNAYSELNDPVLQRSRFQDQWDQKDEGEKLLGRQADEGFSSALEYGLVPTAGWGLGVDRLVMILTSKHSIRDVVLFPALKSGSQQ